jgi:hypothetical protein
MRAVTEKICRAFQERRALKLSNSFTDGDSLWLFGNMIAMYRNGDLFICNGGWNSVTTKERLNGLRGVSIVQRRGVWFLNGNEWDGSWINISQLGSRPQPIQLDPDSVEVQEIEFDTTLEWIEEGGYNMPIYTVARKDSEAELFACEVILNANSIQHRIIETDTAGRYKPNFFLIVRPDDHQKALSILNQI